MVRTSQRKLRDLPFSKNSNVTKHRYKHKLVVYDVIKENLPIHELIKVNKSLINKSL